MNSISLNHDLDVANTVLVFHLKNLGWNSESPKINFFSTSGLNSTMSCTQCPNRNKNGQQSGGISRLCHRYCFMDSTTV